MQITRSNLQSTIHNSRVANTAQAEPHLFSAEQVAWLDTLAAEHNNLRAALDWAVERADAHAALRMVTALRSFWYTRGHYDEGQRRMLQVLAMPAAQERTTACASALNAAAALLWPIGNVDAALPLLDEALAIGRELDDPWNTGFALNNLALAAFMQGDLGRAAALADETLALFQTHGIRGGVVELLITAGQIASAAGSIEQAWTYLAEGVQRGWPAGPHWLVATGLEELAAVVLAQGDPMHATGLCAAEGTWRTRMEAPLPPYRRAKFQATLTALRDALGAAGFAAAWAEGAAWQPDQAVAVMLEPTFAIQRITRCDCGTESEHLSEAIIPGRA